MLAGICVTTHAHDSHTWVLRWLSIDSSVSFACGIPCDSFSALCKFSKSMLHGSVRQWCCGSFQEANQRSNSLNECFTFTWDWNSYMLAKTLTASGPLQAALASFARLGFGDIHGALVGQDELPTAKAQDLICKLMSIGCKRSLTVKLPDISPAQNECRWFR